jgi:hypothetical protein
MTSCLKPIAKSVNCPSKKLKFIPVASTMAGAHRDHLAQQPEI